MTLRIYGGLPLVCFNGIDVDFKPSSELLRDLASLPKNSAVGLGIPSPHDGGQNGKPVPYWQTIARTVEKAGIPVSYLVPAGLRAAEKRHDALTTAADKLDAYNHKTLRDYIIHVSTPQVIERAAFEQQLAAIVCFRPHAQVIAARTEMPYCEESHDLSYLIDSMLLLQQGLEARESGKAYDPDDEGSAQLPEGIDIRAELAMEVEDNIFNRSPAIPRTTLWMQEVHRRRLRAMKRCRITNDWPTHMGSWQPTLAQGGLFELYIQPNRRGEFQGLLEDTVGTARVEGRMHGDNISMAVEYDPCRCMREGNYTQLCHGALEDGRYVGTWQIQGTQEIGQFVLTTLEDMPRPLVDYAIGRSRETKRKQKEKTPRRRRG